MTRRYPPLSKRVTNVAMLSLTDISAFMTVSVLFFILGYLVYTGGRSLSLSFFTQLPAPVGQTGGGMANAIVGTAKLLALATMIGIPIGGLGGVYLAEFGTGWFSFLVRYTTDLLNGSHLLSWEFLSIPWLFFRCAIFLPLPAGSHWVS